jgi:hypothetical protein
MAQFGMMCVYRLQEMNSMVMATLQHRPDQYCAAFLQSLTPNDPPGARPMVRAGSSGYSRRWFSRVEGLHR